VNDSASLTAHQAGAAQCFDLFVTDTLATDLSDAISNFSIIGFRNRRINPTRIEDRKWVSELIFDILCCASELR
jgi:hypothetical protein